MQIQIITLNLCTKSKYMQTMTITEAISKPEKLFSVLEYGSYAANRDYGMTHEQLLSIGIGNDGMKLQYESENFTKQIPID